MIPLGIAHLTALELPPAELVVQAGRAGFKSVGFRVNQAAPNTPCYPLPAGSQALRDVRDLLWSEGVTVNEVEFIPITPEIDVASFRPMFESGAELGAVSVTVSGDDPDFGRLTANFVALCDLAVAFGLRVDVEFMRWREIGNLDLAVALLRAAGRPNGSIVLDALHLDRSGGRPSDIAALPTSFVRSAQLCDAPAKRPIGNDAIIAEARAGRLPPGQGALPLLDIIQSMAPNSTFSVEVPIPDMEVSTRLALVYAAARRVVEAAGL